MPGRFTVSSAWPWLISDSAISFPVTLRSGFYPLLKHRLNGFWGNLIDIVALCATIFGLTTTLGFGAMQLNAGLSAVGIFSTTSFSHIVLLIVIAIFFITSANSGIFVINSIASQGKNTFPKWQTVLWGTLLALLSIGLLYSGGLQALQTMTVIIALPFAVIMILMVFCLLRGLTIDNAYFSRKLSESTIYWDGSHWQDRLKKIVSVGTLDDFQQFLKQTVDPAFQELRQEFPSTSRAVMIVRRPARIQHQIHAER